MQNIYAHIFKLFFIVLFLQSVPGQAQSNITGIVEDSLDHKLNNANVLLLRVADTGLVKGMLTDVNGAFLFRNIPKGDYFVQSTYSGLSTFRSKPFSITAGNDKKDLGIIHLYEKSVQLGEVKVAARKPLLELKADRLIINVENSITSAGSTALEVLERSPGVIVDHQNNALSMNGKDGVVLMVNGKISRVPMAAVVQMLAGMSSNNIEKIELITTPPANFDAGGNAGYINIILKENNNLGTNGSYNLSVGYGKGLITAGGININHRKGKLNLYGDASYSRIKGTFNVDGYSKIKNDGNVFEKYFNLDRKDTTILWNGLFGMDYQFNKRTVSGILFSGNIRHFTQAEKSRSNTYKNSLTDTLTNYSNRELNDWSNYGINVNTHHQCDEDKSLTVNLDYNHFNNNQPVNYHASIFDNAGEFVAERLSRSGKNTYIDFGVAALDYKSKVGKKISLESGLKQTVSGFQNNLSFERLEAISWKKDESLSANYTLKENYSAAYASLDILVNKNTEAKLGARYEYTSSNLGTEVTKNIVDRKYSNVFPTLFLSHTLNENNKLNLSFNTRINRPAFTDLAPFTYYIDANTVLTGNPALQPSFTNTIKADYIFKSYLFSVSYSVEDHAISGFQPEIDSVSLKTILSPQNLENQKSISAVISLPVTITEWWSMQFNITGLWQQVNAIYQKEHVKLSSGNINLYGSQQFNLPKGFSAELSGFYQSKSLSGLSKTNAIGLVDIGVKKKLGQRSSLQVTGSNILNTLKYRMVTDLPDQNLVSRINLSFSYPSLKLTFTHNFGKEKLKEKRERSTGAEEEKGRIHN